MCRCNQTKKYIAPLYVNRKAPVKPFEGNTLYICEDLLSPVSLSVFYPFFCKKRIDLKDRGGIYMFTYKHDPNIYYIGRTIHFKRRLNSHLEYNLNDRFHVFARAVG